MAKLENVVSTAVNIVPVAIFVVSGSGKLVSDGAGDMFEGWGYPRWWAPLTGTTELVAAGLLARPRTSLLGGGLALGVLAGATATHLQHREWDRLAFPLVTLAFVGLSVWRRRSASLPVHEPGRGEHRAPSIPSPHLDRAFEGHATGEL